MEAAIRDLFARYERLTAQALAGTAEGDAAADLYASEVIAASPAGVRGGKNDDVFRQALTQGWARYRAMGTKAMRIRDLRVTPIDPLHALAHVAWTATYAREGRADAVIGFEVHYLVQVRDGRAAVFGWIAGDEEALLKAHGIA